MMEASSSAGIPKHEKIKTEVKSEVNLEPDPARPASATRPKVATYIRIKNEDNPSDDGKVDSSLPMPGGDDDIFEDVDNDEPEYVDRSYTGIVHINDIRYFVCEGFKIRQIPEPYIVKRKLWDLFRCIQAGSILLDPQYQREIVWDEGRAALLITSILMGFFIPPIIFNVKKSMVKRGDRMEEKFTRICVDGKQRLTSVFKFMSGQIGFFDNGSPQKKWYWCQQTINGQVVIANRNILPKAVKDFFESQFFCCYEYEELDLDTEETMFQLVQRGLALTPAEKMRAMSTDWANFTKQYEDDYSLIVNLSKQNRASGFRLILTIFTMIQEVMAGERRKKKVNGGVSTTPTLQASPPALQRVLEDKMPISPALKLRLKSIFDKYETLVKLSSTEISATVWRVKVNSVFDPAPEYLREVGVNHVRTFSPLELVVTAILVAVRMEERTDEELLDDVGEMRKYLRGKHRDLRVNAQCWSTAWEFITEVMERRIGELALVEVDEDGSAVNSVENGNRKRRVRKKSVKGSKSKPKSKEGSSSSIRAEGSEEGGGDNRGSSSLSSAPESEEEGAKEVPQTTRKRKTMAKPNGAKEKIKGKVVLRGSKGRTSGATKPGKIGKMKPKKRCDPLVGKSPANAKKEKAREQ